jgi:tetratricopeptide (TPR) repeat protein
MKEYTRIFATSVFAAAMAFAGPAAAHDSPVHHIDELTVAIAADPANAELLLERAELYRVLEKWPEGLADLQAASRLDPSLQAVQLATATLLLEADAAGPALDAVDRFLEQNDGHGAAHRLRARILRRSGRNLEAAAEFSRGIALAGGKVSPDDYLERAAALADESRFGEAIGGLDDGIAALGAPIALELAAIDLELRRSAHEAALRRLAAIEAKASRPESWIFRRAQVLELAGRRADAARACDEALAAIGKLPQRVQRLEATASLGRKITAKRETLHSAAGHDGAATPRGGRS